MRSNLSILAFDFVYREASTNSDKFHPSHAISCNVFDPSVQSEVPLPRVFGSAVTLHNKIYLFGGHKSEYIW